MFTAQPWEGCKGPFSLFFFSVHGILVTPLTLSRHPYHDILFQFGTIVDDKTKVSVEGQVLHEMGIIAYQHKMFIAQRKKPSVILVNLEVLRVKQCTENLLRAIAKCLNGHMDKVWMRHRATSHLRSQPKRDPDHHCKPYSAEKLETSESTEDGKE